MEKRGSEIIEPTSKRKTGRIDVMQLLYNAVPPLVRAHVHKPVIPVLLLLVQSLKVSVVVTFKSQ